ncbi:MAG TPA: alpha/beta fold hydrolase [Mycobacteriales bacterium]|nr:alpha/beta fold hydrolase [Mycobacteriales bacterium]
MSEHRTAPAIDPDLVEWPGSTVAVGSRSLYVRRAGSSGAAPAVFVHGLGGSSTNWTDLMALLSAHVDGHALDLPGFGRSPAPVDGRYDLDAHVAAVAGYIEEVGLAPVHLFGNSLGGAVTTRLASERPDLVRTLTLVSPALPSLRPVKGGDPTLGMLLVPGLSNVVRRRLERTSPEERLQTLLEIVFADPTRIPAHRLAQATAEIRRRQSLPWTTSALVGSLRGIVRAYLDRSSRGLWQQAARVPVPTLLVYGKQDRIVSFTTAARAAASFPDNRLLELDDVGHVAQMEVPSVVAEAVLRLIADVERSMSA